jgi:hypothetical protein
VGLTDVLIGEVEARDAIQSWGDKELYVLASGSVPPNPSELLGSSRMADLLRDLREWADVIIVDTPPLLSVTDGAVVAVQTDGALLVTRLGKTTQAQVTAASRALQTVAARVLGCVLNMTRASKSDAYYYKAYKVLPGSTVARPTGELTLAGAASPAAAAPVPASPVPASPVPPAPVPAGPVPPGPVPPAPVPAGPVPAGPGPVVADASVPVVSQGAAGSPDGTEPGARGADGSGPRTATQLTRTRR